MCSLTLSDVDIADAAEVERAILALESLHRVTQPGVFVHDVHLSFAGDDVLLLRRTLEHAPPTCLVWRDGAWTLGKRSRALLSATEELIRREGPVTVEQVAAWHGIAPDDARAGLRNAFQAARAYAVPLSLRRTWDEDVGGFRYERA